MKKCFISISIVTSFLFTSCEEVIELDLNQHEKRVVIDANLFVGENNYNKIRLYYSAPFYADGYEEISNATVLIKNISSSETYSFTYDVNGYYVNNNFNPEIDATYELEVAIADNVYTATSKVWIAPEIENVEQINDAGFTGDSYELRFYYQDPKETEDYYLAQTIDTEENDFSVSSDQFTNGNLISDLYFADEEQLGETIFYALAKIDKNYYNYLNKMFSNAASAGNPFATPTGTLKGNIVNTTNTEDFVLGYFHIAKRNSTTYTIE